MYKVKKTAAIFANDITKLSYNTLLYKVYGQITTNSISFILFIYW